MTRIAAAVLLSLALVTGAHAAGSGAISAAVVASPLSVSLSIAPGQLLAWALAHAKGLDPDRPAGLDKITFAA